MVARMKRCRVCGREYEACRSANRVAGVFHWQEVACSPECGAIYLQQINESRGMDLVTRQTADVGLSAVIAADVRPIGEMPVEPDEEE